MTYRKNHYKAETEKRFLFQEKIKNYNCLGYDMPRTQGYSLKAQRCYGAHHWGAKGCKDARGALLNNKLLTYYNQLRNS